MSGLATKNTATAFKFMMTAKRYLLRKPKLVNAKVAQLLLFQYVQLS